MADEQNTATEAEAAAAVDEPVATPDVVTVEAEAASKAEVTGEAETETANETPTTQAATKTAEGATEVAQAETPAEAPTSAEAEVPVDAEATADAPSEATASAEVPAAAEAPVPSQAAAEVTPAPEVAPAATAVPAPEAAPAAEAAPAPESAKKSRVGLIAGVLALIVAVAVAVIVVVNPFGQGQPEDDFYDSGMTLGSYEGKTQEEIIADLNAQVAENEMSISCAPTIEVDSKTGEAEVRIENIAANHVDQKFTIELEDGTMLYESGGIQPGYFVQSVTLDTIPASGEYTSIVTFQGYDPETHAPKGGSAALNVPMTVS